MAYLHGTASAFGRNFCAVVSGPTSAVGQTVTVKGHIINLSSGKCNPLMMGGNPYMHMKAADFVTSGGEHVHWDGNIWSI